MRIILCLLGLTIVLTHVSGCVVPVDDHHGPGWHDDHHDDHWNDHH